MSEQPYISIIIPSLNSPIINEVILGLLRQKKIDMRYEIIVVGQDESVKIIANDIVKFIYTKEPVSPSQARNLGVYHSSGKILIFLDSDCIADKHFLFHHWNAHIQNEKTIIGGSVTFPNKPFLTLCDNVSSFHEFLPWMPYKEKEILPSLNLSLERSLWNELGGFDTKYLHAAGEDADFSFRAREKKITLLFFPSAIVTHLPNRITFTSILKHAYNFGRFSMKIDSRNRRKLPNLFLKNHVVIRTLSPIYSLFLIIKIVVFERIPVRFWKTLPIIFITKIAWCFGAAEGKRQSK